MNKRSLSLGAAILLGLAASHAAAGTLNPTGREITLSMPLISSNNTLGDVLINLDVDDNIKIDSKSFLSVMRDAVSDSHFQKLEGLVGKTESFPWFVLGVLGYNMSYDQSRLELRFDLPATARATKRINSPRERAIASNAELPSKTSAFANIRAGVTRDEQGGFENTDESLAVDGALTIPALGHAAIEAESRLNDDNNMVREGTRLLVDRREKNQRWKLGDIESAYFSHMGSENIAGISVESNRSTFSGNTSHVTGRTSFLLSRKSTVRVYVNGELQDTLRLDAGPYELSDIAVSYGSNRVTLEIEDDTGLVETRTFNLFSDNTFLAKGEAEYSVAVGVERTNLPGERIEYLDDPVASGYYRRGVSEQLTLGAFGKTRETVDMAGSEVLVGAMGARLSLEGAATRDNEGGETEYALDSGLSYRIPEQINKKDASIFLGTSFETNRFNKTLSEIEQKKRLSSRLTYRQRITPEVGVSLIAEHTDNRVGDDEKDVGLDVGFSRDNLYVSLSLEQSLVTDDTTAQLRLTHRLSERSSLRATHDFESSSTLDHSAYSDKKGTGEWSRRIGVSHNDDADQGSVDFSGTYKANRTEVSAYHSETIEDDQGRVANVSSATLSSAIAYSGGKVAVGRPVRDSFMIVSTYDNLDDRKVSVQPDRDGGSYSSSGLLGPALYGEVISYAENTVGYDVEDLPLGYNLGDGNRKVFPTYKSGYSTVVGSSATVSAIGTLYDNQGRLLSLRSGQARPINAESSDSVTVFTNASGRFSAQGLSPGSWELVMGSKTGGKVRYMFSVPGKTVGLWRAGKLSPAG